VLETSLDLQISDVDIISPRLCDAFLKARHVRGSTLDDAATALGITPRELRAIESGSSHPEPEMIRRIAEHYRIDADRLGTDVMVRRSDPAIDPAACTIWFGWLPIEYGSNLASNRAILDAVADGVRLLRSADPMASVQMRSGELDLVMTLLDLDDDDLVADAVRAFRLPWKHTEQLIAASSARVRSTTLVAVESHLIKLDGNEGDADGEPDGSGEPDLR
jgi:transcriptional regulator with XRE-family HTH domain